MNANSPPARKESDEFATDNLAALLGLLGESALAWPKIQLVNSSQNGMAVLETYSMSDEKLSCYAGECAKCREYDRKALPYIVAVIIFVLSVPVGLAFAQIIWWMSR